MNVSLRSSSVLVSLLFFGIPVIGDLSPVNLKSVREEVGDEVWSTEFEVVLQHRHFKYYRFRF